MSFATFLMNFMRMKIQRKIGKFVFLTGGNCLMATFEEFMDLDIRVEE